MILAFDTSGSRISIALADDDGTILRAFQAEASAMERGIHDARLASETAKLLEQEHAKPSDISRIGLIIGPGSFTGLRIGLSFAKGFSFATGAAIVPITQHEVIAAHTNDDIIITAGYREDLFYVASRNSPQDIRLVGPNELPASFELGSPAIDVLAHLTVAAREVHYALAIETLEPLYITEFAVRDAK
jgi:tRNA threonylcarbamoyl adenosine modification protein YeaZ